MIQKKTPVAAGAATGTKKQETTIYGLRPVIEAIDGGVQIDNVLMQNGLSGQLAGELKGRIRDKNIPFQFVPVEKLNRMTKGNHQGVAALIAPIAYQQAIDLIPKLMDEGKVLFLLMLDHVTDVRNFGAIVRTAECAGVDAVIIRDSSEGAALFASKVMSPKVKVPIVLNAGDGAHAHPSQALLELFTMKEAGKKIKGMKYVIIGDILHSRVARSDIYGFSKLGAEVHLVGPRTLVPKELEDMGCIVDDNLEDALKDICHLEMVIGGDSDCRRRRLKTKLIAMGMQGFSRVLLEKRQRSFFVGPETG